MRKLARAIVRLYPHGWRARYEVEFVALLESRPLTWPVIADVAMLAARGLTHMGWLPPMWLVLTCFMARTLAFVRPMPVLAARKRRAVQRSRAIRPREMASWIVVVIVSGTIIRTDQLGAWHDPSRYSNATMDTFNWVFQSLMPFMILPMASRGQIVRAQRAGELYKARMQRLFGPPAGLA